MGVTAVMLMVLWQRMVVGQRCREDDGQVGVVASGGPVGGRVPSESRVNIMGSRVLVLRGSKARVM